MTTKRALELVEKINNGERLPMRTNNAFWKFLDSRSLKWVENNCYKHHTSLSRGFAKVGRPSVASYNGNFGLGFKVFRNNPESSMYCFVDYMIL